MCSSDLVEQQIVAFRLPLRDSQRYLAMLIAPSSGLSDQGQLDLIGQLVVKSGRDVALRMRGDLVVDGRNAFDAKRVREAGLLYEGMGRGVLPRNGRSGTW